MKTHLLIRTHARSTVATRPTPDDASASAVPTAAARGWVIALTAMCGIYLVAVLGGMLLNQAAFNQQFVIPFPGLGEDPDHEALLAAIFRNNATQVRALLDSRSAGKLEATDFYGCTPLIHAVRRADSRAQMEIVVELLRRGADVNRPETTSGLTPLAEAVRARDDGVAAVLLRAGANPNAADHCGATALHHAAGADPETDYVAMLLKSGADPNRLDVNGASPADWARLAGKCARAVQLRHAAFSDMAVE